MCEIINQLVLFTRRARQDHSQQNLQCYKNLAHCKRLHQLFNDSHFRQATISINKSNFLICFCCFYLSCSILEKDNFIRFFNIMIYQMF